MWPPRALIETIAAISGASLSPSDGGRYAIFAAITLTLGRLLTRSLVSAARRRSLVSYRTLIIGSGNITDALVRSLLQSPEYGLRLVASLADDPPLPGSATARIPQVGTSSELLGAVRATGASVVIVSTDGFVESHLLDVISDASTLECDLFVVPRLLCAELRVTDHIGAIPLTRINATYRVGFRQFLKRLFDVVLSTVALLAMSPLLDACALAVRLGVGRPILYKQLRIGADGTPFVLLKFRSLTPMTSKEGDTNWTIAGDPRVGRVGQALRRFGLDELPQLWNILRGDMTFVGPRPERPFFVEQFNDTYPDYRHRLRVTPGLTGLAQVCGLRGDTSIEARVRHDNYYIEHWSLWLDTKVIVRTISEVLRGSGR